MDTLGTFTGINIGASALTAASLGESVIGNNISNADTPGYADETLVLSNAVPQQASDMAQGAYELGYVGTGVTSVTVTRASDEFLAQQVYTANSAVSDQTAQQNQLNAVQSAFNEPGNVTINTQLAQFFDNFTTLAGDPSDTSNQTTAIQGGVLLAQMMNQTSSQLTSSSDAINQSITADESQINNIAQQIATLNVSIVANSTLNGQPNASLDQRDALLSKLSNLANVTVSSNSDGSDNIKIGSTVLVSGVTANTVSASTMQSRGDITGGDLGGLEISLTNVNSYSTSLDTLAQQLISAVNTIHAAGFGSDGTTGLPFFTGTGAANIGVNPTLVNNPQKLAVASSIPTGGTTPAPGDTSNATAIANLQNTVLGSSAGAMSGQTFGGFYNSLVTSLGNAASNADDNLTSATASQTQLTTQQNSISGVNEDDELTKMMEFQKMYQAASEVISTQNSMLSDLINNMFTLT